MNLQEIKNYAKKKAEEKYQEELKKKELEINKESEQIEYITNLINNEFLVKVIKQSNSTKEFRVATIKDFEIDYCSDYEYAWGKGIHINEPDNNKGYLEIIVNGNEYMHIAGFYSWLKKQIDDVSKRINTLSRDLSDYDSQLTNLANNSKLLKKVIQTNEYLNLLDYRLRRLAREYKMKAPKLMLNYEFDLINQARLNLNGALLDWNVLDKKID